MEDIEQKTEDLFRKDKKAKIIEDLDVGIIFDDDDEKREDEE